MQSFGWSDYCYGWRRQAAWRDHYISKGYSRRKAELLAYDKVRRKGTWPPR